MVDVHFPFPKAWWLVFFYDEDTGIGYMPICQHANVPAWATIRPLIEPGRCSKSSFITIHPEYSSVSSILDENIKMQLKDKPQHVAVDPAFRPLPEHGHLSEKCPDFVAAEPAIDAIYKQLWALPDFQAFREAAGDADAVMPPGGPDRYRDVTTELLQFPARDGQLVELKVYKSPQVKPNATLMYRMHGGGMYLAGHEMCLPPFRRG